MLFRYTFISIIIAALSFTENHAFNITVQKSDSCWNRIKLSCGGTLKQVTFNKDLAPGLLLSDYAKIDSLGVIKEEQLLSDTVSLTIKKHTFWETNAKTNSVERKILTIDSIVEKFRWDCEYVGPGKGTCSSCQVTDCNGLPLGPLKTTKSNPIKQPL
jgi:hypothetical protein